MPVPPFHRFLAPCLLLFGDGNEHSWQEAVTFCAQQMNLGKGDLEQRLRSGRSKVETLVTWALTYLRQAKLIESTGRNRNRITERGLELLGKLGRAGGFELTLQDLEAYPEFIEFLTRHKETRSKAGHRLPASVPAPPEQIDQASQDQIAQAWETLHSALEDRVLREVQKLSPMAFERLVLRLLSQLGYGSSDGLRGEVMLVPRDDGLDGVVSGDKLGLDTIYLRAKRLSAGKLGRLEVQAFLSSMVISNSSKGVLLTTSEFTREAVEFAQGVKDQRVVLVDGRALAKLMVENNLGVAVERTYEIKRLDRSFFEIGLY
ncbi:MAG: restriction endonuclease [Fimbriimonadales bacterium]|nr:restriction endonuclease [Fimbriimonadales bacterium]